MGGVLTTEHIGVIWIEELSQLAVFGTI